MKKLSINHRALPVFADRALTASQVSSKASKRSKGKAERKEGVIRLLFVDSVSNSTVADVVLTSIGAEQLISSIEDSLGKLKKELAQKAMPVEQKPKKQEHTYIG